MEYIINYQKYNSLEQLPAEDRELLAVAAMRAHHAAAEYSHFRVGAAARLCSGEIVSAANVESEVYPSGLCAERALLYFVRSNYPEQRILDIAITSISGDAECYPCGACRQVLLDSERAQRSPIRVVMGGSSSATVLATAAALLPFSFKLESSDVSTH